MLAVVLITAGLRWQVELLKSLHVGDLAIISLRSVVIIEVDCTKRTVSASVRKVICIPTVCARPASTYGTAQL